MSNVQQVMAECNNYFNTAYIDGHFTISDDGEISPCEAIGKKQYIAITGSMTHDGVYCVTDGWLGYDEEKPFGEEFDGRVWLLSPPPSFLRLCTAVQAFEAANKGGESPYQSESFGAYSYSKATGKSGGLLTWQEAFADKLTPYRRMFTEVAL